MIQEIFLKMSWPNWVFALCVLLAGIIAYLFYNRTLPPLSLGRRIPGFILRTASLSIVLFLILEPVMQLLYRNSQKPVVAVLFDNSASMNIEETYGKRSDSLRYVLQNLDNVFLQDSVDVRRYRFDLNVQTMKSDSLDLTTDGSNLARAIEAVNDSLSAENLQGIVLVSDGIYNQGVSPVLTAGRRATPVHTVTVGDSKEPKDIAISRIQANSITYVGKKTPVEVIIRQNGYDGQKSLLSIYNRGKRIAQKQVTLGRSGFEQKETLEIVATEPGTFTWSVEMQSLNGEKTDKNNRRLQRVQVLKSKVNVLVMSGGADFDRRFLKFAGDKLEDFNIQFRTELQSGRYFEGAFNTALLDSQDLVVFHGFPTRNSSAANLQELRSVVTQKKKPVLWFLNRSTDVSKAGVLGEFLPFQAKGAYRPVRDQVVALTAAGRLHPALKLTDVESVNDLQWQELPPVEFYTGIVPRDGAGILMGLDDKSEGNLKNAPIYFSYKREKVKQLVFRGSNVGNWHFQLQEDPARNELFVNWLERSMRWLVNRDDIEQIQIRSLQAVYNVGEAVALSGQVYDAFYNQIADADVSVTIRNDSTNISDELNAAGNGFYSRSFSGLPEGDYRYTVRASRNERDIGSRSGRFSIKPFYLEYQQVSANKELMNRLATATQGETYSAKQFVNSFDNDALKSRLQISFEELFIWNFWQWLPLLILLLGVEWFLRKRWGLL